MVSEIEIGGQTFTQVAVLMQQLQIWSTNLPLAIYQTYLDEGADFLTTYVDTQEAKHEEVLAEYYNLARSTHPDFETYRKSAKYSQIWGRIDAAAENRAKNEQKRKRAREEVKKNWGSQGETFLEINDALGVKKCLVLPGMSQIMIRQWDACLGIFILDMSMSNDHAHYNPGHRSSQLSGVVPRN